MNPFLALAFDNPYDPLAVLNTHTLGIGSDTKGKAACFAFRSAFSARAFFWDRKVELGILHILSGETRLPK